MVTGGRSSCFVFAFFLLVSLVWARAVSAQGAGTKILGGNDKIYLDVVAAPKSGAPVADLLQQDFTVLDNKAPQAITSFKTVTGREAPIEVMLVIDAVNTNAQILGYEQQQVDKFLRADGGHLSYPTVLAVFTDKGVQILGNVSSDGNALSAALQDDKIGLRFITRASGYYGAEERLQLSIDAMDRLVQSEIPRPGRKVMIWISPGWPLLSGPNTQLDTKQQEQVFGNIVRLSTQLTQARVTLYSVDPIGAGESVFRATYYEEFVKGVSKPGQANIGNLGLQVLAIQSGGLAMNFDNDISNVVQQCVTESAPYYEISFKPSAGRQQNEYHHLEVKIARPGLVARTRQGYYAQPSAQN
jgi:VWFA-related protein